MSNSATKSQRNTRIGVTIACVFCALGIAWAGRITYQVENETKNRTEQVCAVVQILSGAILAESAALERRNDKGELTPKEYTIRRRALNASIKSLNLNTCTDDQQQTVKVARSQAVASVPASAIIP